MVIVPMIKACYLEGVLFTWSCLVSFIWGLCRTFVGQPLWKATTGPSMVISRVGRRAWRSVDCTRVLSVVNVSSDPATYARGGGGFARELIALIKVSVTQGSFSLI